MQIHELNNYNGNKDVAYLALDNGNDTGKILVPTLLSEVNDSLTDLNGDIASLVTRIDNIVSGVTVNSEVIDARTGVFGGVYNSLGAALRNQIGFSDNILGIVLNYGYVKNNGQVSTGGSDRLFSDWIPCPPLTPVTYVGENNHASVLGLAFYDQYRRFISGDGNHGSLGDETTVTSPQGTCFVRISTKTSIINNTMIKFGDPLRKVLDSLQVQINNINSFAYVDGSTGTDNYNSGSPQVPFKTIQGAIDFGFRNLIVSPGTYKETINIDGGSIRISSNWATFVSGSVTDLPKIIIDGDSSVATALTIQNCSNVILNDVVVQNCTGDGALINKCANIILHNCEFLSNGNNGVVINYSNGVIRDCKADNNGNDGFNMNYFGDTQFYNCSGHDNGDDGISHHQGCTGVINGGEWYNNGKGGVASPAHGAQVDLLNFYSHNNGYGVYANADSDTVARTFRAWNLVLTNNSQYGMTCKRNHCLMYNCKISGNSAGQTTAPSGGSITVLD